MRHGDMVAAAMRLDEPWTARATRIDHIDGPAWAMAGA